MKNGRGQRRTTMRGTRTNRRHSNPARVTRLRPKDASRIVRAPNLWDEKPDLQATREYLRDARNVFLLAVEGPTPVGFLRATSLRQIKSRYPQMFLYEIGVTHGHRRRGVGRALVRWLLDYCRKNDFEEIFVLTSPGNRAAVRLYRATGALTETEADRMFVYRLGAPRR